MNEMQCTKLAEFLAGLPRNAITNRRKLMLDQACTPDEYRQLEQHAGFSTCTLKIEYYDPKCQHYDGITNHVPGISVRAISHEGGGFWHRGIHLVEFESGKPDYSLFNKVRDYCASSNEFNIDDGVPQYMKGY